MTEVTYLEGWAEMQPVEEKVDAERTLPKNFEVEEFDDEQLEYLKDYLVEYRLESIIEFVKFLLNDAPHTNSEKSKVAYFQRIVCKLVLMRRLLDYDLQDMPWNEVPKNFGLSSHVFFDVKDCVFKELCKISPRINKVMQMRRKSRGAALR